MHENEHLGISKLNLTSPITSKESYTKYNGLKDSNEVSKDKLKKIVSFFDKFVDHDKDRNEFSKKKVYSEVKLSRVCSSSVSGKTVCVKEENKEKGSTHNILKSKSSSHKQTVLNNHNNVIKCHICDQIFTNRRQLGVHVDIEHRMHNKFSKFHSCTGIIDTNRKKHDSLNYVSGDGTLKVQSLEESASISDSIDNFSIVTQNSSLKSDVTISFDPSTSVSHSNRTSKSGSKKTTTPIDSVERDKSGVKICPYTWEPGTKIIYI